jgi:hypothetical protein
LRIRRWEDTRFLDKKIREDNFCFIRRWGIIPELRSEDEGIYLILDKKMEEDTLILDKKMREDS